MAGSRRDTSHSHSLPGEPLVPGVWLLSLVEKPPCERVSERAVGMRVPRALCGRYCVLWSRLHYAGPRCAGPHRVQRRFG